MAARRRKAESGILASVRKTVIGLHKGGVLVDDAALRELVAQRRGVIRTVDLTKEEIEEMTSGRMGPEHDHLNSLLEDR